MDRNREARRGSMAAAAVNGSSGLSRRRQRRTSNLRDSTDEDGGMELQEPSRLRDRGVKKDRDRDRERSSSRSKRRRGERLMHESSNRGEGDDSSDESMDEDDGDEDDEVGVRLPLQGNSSSFPPSTSSQQHSHNHHNQSLNHFRKSNSFLGSNNNISKPVRPSAQLMKVSEEMIGVSIPRKARSSMKRPQEYSGTGEPIHHRQDSASPARHSPSSNTATSPPSSNLSIRKKKSISGSKHRPPKMAKSPPVSSTIQEIEIAEVLFGMTRQAPLPVVDKQETNKVETKDDNPNGLNAEAKSRVSSPNSVSQTQASSQQQSVLPMKVSAPKRKRPRLRLEEESPTSSVAATSAKIEAEMASKMEEVTSPRSKKNHAESGTVDNETGSSDPSKDCVDNQKELVKQESSNQGIESREEVAIKEKVGILGSNFVDKNEEKVVSSGADKSVVVKEGPQKARFSIDLMAPPSIMDKSTSDKDGLSDFSSDHKDTGSEKKLLPFSDIDKSEKTLKNEGMSDHQNVGNFLSKGFDLKQQQVPKEKLPDLHLNLDKHDKEGGLSLGCNGSKQQLPFPKQQQKTARVDHKQEKQAPTASMPLPVPIAGWPSGFPSFGYMGQVPPLQAVVPLDGSSLAPNTIQPPNFIQPQQQLKRCATHCYIARNIHSHQQFARMTNPFWAAAAAVGASGTPLYGTKYNLNAVPPSESTAAILGNPLQAGFPPVSLSTLQEKSAPKEMSSTNATAVTNSNLYLDAAAAHRKQFLLQQSSQPGSSATPPTMISGPTIIFPINQQSSVANQPGPALKSTPGASGVTATTPPATIANTTATPSVSFNYAGMNPNDARCMAFMQSNAILQNNAYPFSMAAAAAAAAAQAGSPTPYKGANPAQAMPFFNGPFYSPQMVPSQQQMQLGQHMMQQQQMQRQQIHQQQQQESSSAAQPPRNNSSTSSGSSSSQKHTQQAQQRVLPGSGIAAGVSNTHNFQTSLKQQPLNLMSRQARQLENETAREGSPSSTGDNIRLSHQAQKSVYGQSFAMPKMPPQNFALISPATAATAMVSSGANRNDKQQQQNQHHALKELTPSQVYAMSFASFGGPATAGGPGFDFSNIVQNPALLQNLPEVTRHGYQIPAAAAAATQHKKTQHEDAKSVGDSGTSNKASSATDEAKTATTANKQQSLNFSRPDNDHAMTNIITNLADASSRPSTAGSRPLNPPSYSAAPSSAAAAANPSSFNMSPKSQQQYYQHVIEFQRQQQQRMHFLQQQQQQQQKMPASNRQNVKPGTSPMAAPNNSSSSVNNPTSVSSSMAPNRFPPLSVLQQGSGSSGASHSPQWKPSTPSNNRQSMTPIAAASSNSSSSAKNQILQQQQQLHHQQQAQQISFGGVGLSSSNKPATNQSVAPLNVGSPQSSISKSSAAAAATGGGSNGGSPRAAAASSDSKSLPPPSIQHQQQMIAAAAAAKHSQTVAGSSNLKPSSPITTTTNNSNRNLNSMLGHPQMASAPSNSTNNKNNKVHPQKQQQQQMQKQQQQNFQQPQIFFNSPYIHQAQQNTQSNAKSSTASGMLSLSSSLILAGGSSAGAASDPAKAAAGAGSNKGMTNTQQQQAAAQYAAATAAATSMAPHPFMPAYPYMHAMQTPAVSNKTATTAADKKQQQSTTGQGENTHASWKPEKR